MKKKIWNQIISTLGAGALLVGVVFGGGLEVKAANQGEQKPADYFHKVEAASQAVTIDALTQEYGIRLEGEKDLYEKGSDVTVSLQAAVHENLVKELGLEGLKNFEWKSDVSLKGMSGKINSKIYLNDKQLLNFIAFIDGENGIEYDLIPELSKAYLKITGLMVSNGQNVIYKHMTEDMLNGLLKKYAKIITEGLNTVSLKEGVEISAGGQTGKYDELTVTISQKDVAGIFKELIVEALSDGTLMQLCVDAKICTKKEYIAGLNEAMGYVEKVKIEDFDADELPKLKVWVDSFGKVVGREISMPSEHENAMGYMSIADGSNRGFEFWVSDSGYESGIKINGILDGNNAFSGDAEITSEDYYYDERRTTTNINIKNANFNNVTKGYLDGEFIITDNVEKDMKTIIRCYGSPTQQNIKVDVLEKDVVMAAVIVDMKRGLYTDFNFPGNGEQVFDADTEIEDYLETTDIVGFLKGIKEKTDLPWIHEFVDGYLELL